MLVCVCVCACVSGEMKGGGPHQELVLAVRRAPGLDEAPLREEDGSAAGGRAGGRAGGGSGRRWLPFGGSGGGCRLCRTWKKVGCMAPDNTQQQEDERVSAMSERPKQRLHRRRAVTVVAVELRGESCRFGLAVGFPLPEPEQRFDEGGEPGDQKVGGR